LFGDPALKITEITNNPPAKPSQPCGPTTGITGVDYTFTTSTTDPDPDSQLYYQWNWGNEESDWFGPYASGQSVQAIHSWSTAGDYQVKVKAKDSTGVESEWSDTTTIHIVAGPQIEIGTITGGLKITAEIKNTGLVNATSVNWTITLQGLILFGQKKDGAILTIIPNDNVDISTGLVFGLGNINITITAAHAKKTATAFLLGPFILNIR
jgi:hypothetical protein